MPPTPPTTAEINALLITQIELALNQITPSYDIAYNRVLAKSIAGLYITGWKYGNFMFLQQFVARAYYGDITVNGITLNPLIEWGRLIGEGDPVTATNTEMDVTITVTNQVDSLAAGTLITSNLNGVIYSLNTAVLLDAATVTGTFTAVNDADGNGGAGSLGNLNAADPVSFVNPETNVARDAAVAIVTVTGVNGETEDAYRARVVNKFQKPPQGGAYADYLDWGTDVLGIINIYPYSGTTPGDVDVYAEATVDSSGSADGIPTPAQLTAVEASIQKNEAGLATRRPIGAFSNTLPITRQGFDVEVTGLNVTDEATVQAEITTALSTYFLSREPFIDGLTLAPRSNEITINAIISVVSSSVSARSGTFTTAILTLSGSSIPIITPYALNPGQKAKLGTPSFTP